MNLDQVERSVIPRAFFSARTIRISQCRKYHVICKEFEHLELHLLMTLSCKNAKEKYYISPVTRFIKCLPYCKEDLISQSISIAPVCRAPYHHRKYKSLKSILSKIFSIENEYKTAMGCLIFL